MNNYKDIDYALARVLLNHWISKRKTMTYSDCAAILTEKLGRPVYAHGSLRMPLYHVAGMCNDLGLPFLSTIVTLKYQPKNMQAGEGFYKMACEYRPENKKMNTADVWRAEQLRLEKCRDWSKLDRYLKRHGW